MQGNLRWGIRGIEPVNKKAPIAGYGGRMLAGPSGQAFLLATRFVAPLSALQTDYQQPALKGRHDIAQGEALGGQRTTQSAFSHLKKPFEPRPN